MKKACVKFECGFFSLVIRLTVAALMFSIMSVSAETKTLYQAQSDCVNWRFGMYIHFNMNTFYPGWGEARRDPKTFAPTNVDCGQWARAAVSAKMKFGVLVTKHHDGFCLWPSNQTPPRSYAHYTVKESAYPYDIVKMYVDSFRVYKLQPGLYFSMWDASCGIPGCYATPATVRAEWAADSAYVMGQLTELMTNYGEIPLLIFDGYSWDMGHWAFPYQCVRALVKRLQPNCIITDHNGLLNEPWEQDIADFEEPLGIKVPSGNTYASQQENTISGDWFWDSTAANISKLKTVSFITQHLDTLEPRWCNFLLNCPPNKTGLLDTAIVTRIAQVGAAWSPDTLRAALPEQPAMIERPITPISATASSNSSTAVNAIDNTNDYSGGHAQSLWTSSGSLPQYVTLDLGKVYDTIDMLMYQPRRESSTTGNITSYRVLVSTDGTTFTQVDSGTWAANVLVKRSQFQRQSAQYVRLEARAVNGSTLAVINTIAVGAHLSYSQPVNVYQGTASSAALPSEAGTYKAMGRVLLDKRLSGNNVAVTVYDLSGKVKGTKIISGKSFDLQKDIGVSDGVYIIKINHTR